jgi:hypothetical protein
VGVTETTATINYFRYGNPPDPSRPIRCCWRNGTQQNVDRAFLDRLQGNDLDTLRRAEGIDHLEYLLPHSFLREVTLVDTPGTTAVVDEHQDRTAAFLQLRQQLRQRHEEATQRLGSEADAIIYLVGQVPRATDQAFLEEFNRATGGRSRALNALGVLAKIEINRHGVNRRFVVTNLCGDGQGIYHGFYVQRGAVPEKPIGELKNGLGMDRLSFHRFRAMA